MMGDVTAREARKKAIRERVSAATPGPWMNARIEENNRMRAALAALDDKRVAAEARLADTRRIADNIVADLAAAQVRAEAAEARTARLQALATWLVSLDDPEDVVGREQRWTVTLTQIVEAARAALSLSDGKGDGE